MIVASVGSRGADASELHVSRDQGETWTRVPDIPLIMTAAVDPWHPGTVYASAFDAPSILKSTDSGATWQPLPSIPVPDDRGRDFAFERERVVPPVLP